MKQEKKRQKSQNTGRGIVDAEKPIPPEIYPILDTDLARDNVENDLPAADLEDL